MEDNKSETTLKEYVPWEKHHETIFVDWADKASCYNWLHNKSYINYSYKRNLFTIPVIIMSTLTGTANFALERIPLEYQDICSIAIGSVNILAGIITTVSQFLKLNELTESHRVSAIAWDKFHRSIRVELIKAPEERMDVTYFMKTSRDEFDRLMETCPNIEKKVIHQFRNTLTKGGNKTDNARKLKNFNRLIKPEIFDELNTLKDVVYKSAPMTSIQTDEKDKLRRLTLERDKHHNNVSIVRNFIDTFQNKYSRHPSQDEMVSNLQGISIPDLKIILEEIKIDP
tara:strand:- start:3376 stop:4230 length:855 start_codon:yes stop_codon:yes gene_type:complete